METAHVFGLHEHLYGIYRQSSGGSRPNMAAVMLTAGMLPSSGPMRLHVQLAEQLANRGIPSFRFDLSGIGESLPSNSDGSSLQRAACEVEQALDFLQEEYQHTEFALFGLCSGADDALSAALAEQRICGLALMDGCGYRTWRFHPHRWLRNYLPKLFRPSKWLAALGQFAHGTEKSASSMPFGSDIREFPDRETAERQILQLVDRGLQFKFIYTGGVMDYYSYADQFYDMFPRVPLSSAISVDYFPHADHLATLSDDRDLILDALVEWFMDVNKTVQDRHRHHQQRLASADHELLCIPG